MAEEQKENPSVPIGCAGYSKSGGFVDEEFLTQLRGDRGRRMFRQMWDNDPTLGAIMFGVTSFARQTSINVEAAETPRGIEMKEFVESVLEDMQTPLDNHVSEAFSMLPFGFSLFEIVAKARTGYEFGNDEKNSRFDDGLIGISRLSPRPQESLYRWIMRHEVDPDYPDNGDVYGFEQQPPNGGANREIPLSRCLHYIANPRKGNPEGVSAFRNAFRSWYFLKNLEEYEAIGIERNLGGLPVIEIPSEVMNKAAGIGASGKDQADALRTVRHYESIAKDIKKNSRGGVVLPSDTYLDKEGNPTAQKKVILRLLTAEGTDPKTGEAIVRKQQEIARAFFAQFIMLGTKDGGGNRALSQNISDLFMTALDGWMEIIAGVLNQQLLPYLWHLNAAAGFDINDMPTISFDSVKPADLDALSKILQAMTGAGFQIGTDENVENYVREKAGMPERDETNNPL